MSTIKQALLLQLPEQHIYPDLGEYGPKKFKSFANYLEHQFRLYSDNVLARYYLDNTIQTLTYSQVDQITCHLACKWAKDFEGIKVVAYLGDPGLQYFIVMVALLRAGIVMLAASHRTSETALVHLLQKTESSLLMADPKYETIAAAAATKASSLTSNNNTVEVRVLRSFDIIELLKSSSKRDAYNSNPIRLEPTDADILKDVMIIHSSGSTGLPKPVFLSNRYLFNASSSFDIQPNGSEDLTRTDASDVFLACVPVFHCFGFSFQFTAFVQGSSLVFLNKLPPSQDELAKILKEACVTLLAVPALILGQMITHIKQTGESEVYTGLKYVLYGGAPLKPESGEWLCSNNINIGQSYGASEIGNVMLSSWSKTRRLWRSVAPLGRGASRIIDGMFEVDHPNQPDILHFYIQKDSPSMASNVSNRPDGGYSTNDLFKEDPDLPGYYIYMGRRDDLLVMENGEKTNPIPMEAAIQTSPMVQQAIVLGHGRQCTMALIQLNKIYCMDFDPHEVILGVQNAVKRANADCPNYSIILPEMIKILPFNQTIPVSDKGSIQRKQCEIVYQDVINKMYQEFLDGSTLTSNNSSCITMDETREFLAGCASSVLGLPSRQLSDYNQSLFDLGLNSLTAVQFRNRLAIQFESISSDFVFQHSNINSMAQALLKPHLDSDVDQVELRYQQTQQLAQTYIDKAKLDFATKLSPQECTSTRDCVVLLTGATGSLGSFMLRDLLQNKKVKKVYCCVRGNSDKDGLHYRLLESFKSRSLDTSLLLNTDRVEALPMRFDQPFLGFGKERHDQLKKEITVVQHCAWLLDFNMTINHFDKECISPFYSLLKFAYQDFPPMHVHFVSSISASANAAHDEILEEPLPLDAHSAMSTGYAQSKFVAEMILNHLATENNFPCYIERLAQVSGDSTCGIWNTSEQFPLLFIGGGAVMHKMPDLDIVVDWIPLDYAAATIVDIMISKFVASDASLSQFVYHVANPHLIHWSDVLDAMRQCGMTFEVVSPSTWAKELAMQDERNPAYRLLSFFEANFNSGAYKLPTWDTAKTSQLVPVIKKAPVFSSILLGKYLRHWQATGFYHNNSSVKLTPNKKFSSRRLLFGSAAIRKLFSALTTNNKQHNQISIAS